MTLYEYKMLSEDEQNDTVFAKGRYQLIGFGPDSPDSFSFVILWRRNYRDRDRDGFWNLEFGI